MNFLNNKIIFKVVEGQSFAISVWIIVSWGKEHVDFSFHVLFCLKNLQFRLHKKSKLQILESSLYLCISPGEERSCSEFSPPFIRHLKHYSNKLETTFLFRFLLTASFRSFEITILIWLKSGSDKYIPWSLCTSVIWSKHVWKCFKISSSMGAFYTAILDKAIQEKIYRFNYYFYRGWIANLSQDHRTLTRLI